LDRYEELLFDLPEEVPEGILVIDKKPEDQPENIQVSVHFGPTEELFAMATIDWADVKALVTILIR